MKPATCKTVLLVDDSRIVRERLLALVSELPHVEVVGEASGAIEAIRKIRRLRPQIVVLDISMPDGSGIHVLQALRKQRHSPLHVIMLTNFAQDAYREKCIELGAEYFFDKSVEFQNAVETIRELSLTPSDAEAPLLGA